MIFVFGSNVLGRHGAGAAREAFEKHGAVMGQGEGMYGQSYALPTVGIPMLPLSVGEVDDAVARFLNLADVRPDLTFQVTRVGCGLAGFTDAEIAPLFADAPENCQFDEAWKEWLPNKRFWGTYP